MRIAYLVSSLRKTGPVVVVYELASQMVQRGNNVIVYYFDEANSNLLEFPCETKRISFKDEIDFSKYDVVNSHNIRPDLFIFIHKPFKKNKTIFVTTLHNFVLNDFIADYGKIKGVLLGNLWMMIVKRHNMRVVLSNVAKDYYRKWFKESQMTVIYNTRNIPQGLTLSNDEQKELLDFKKDSVLLGINAILTPIKGIDIIIRALSFLPNIKLYIVGDGKSKQDLQQQAINLGVNERVYFAGYRDNAFRYLPFYDLYMMPSRSEGFPLALLEAVALKCNVVVSDIPIFKEIFSDQEVTFFKMNDVESLVDAINYSLIHDKSEKAYEKYIKDYAPNIFGDAYLRLYNALFSSFIE